MTSSCGLWYTVSTSKRVYFFVQKIGRAAFRPSLSETDSRRKDLERSSFLREAKQSDYTGGAEHEGKSNLGLLGVQAAQLQHDEMSKYCRFCKKHTTHKETK